MNVLVVGAGSIGQVLSHHLHHGGCDVTVLVRRGRLATASRRYVLYPLNRRNARQRPIDFSAFELLTPASGPGDQTWDQIYVCIPSDELRDPLLTWIARNAAGGTIVKLQPGLKDLARYERHFPRSQVVSGMLSVVSYSTPIADEQVPEPGTAYWFPPSLPCFFGGTADRVEQVTAALHAGGLPARSRQGVESLIAFVLAVEAPLTVGVECAKWSLETFLDGPWLNVAAQAIVESTAVASRHLGVPPPQITKFLSPAVLKWIAKAAPKKRPIPLEAYLERHFTKLKTQSRQHLAEYIDAGSEYGLNVTSLIKLNDCLEAISPVA